MFKGIKIKKSTFVPVIPDRTLVIAEINSVSINKKSEYQDQITQKNIQVNFIVVGGDYDGVKLKLKAHVNHVDKDKKKAAIQLLGAIDANGTGALYKAFEAGDDVTSTDVLNDCLNGSVMGINVRTWGDDKPEGNWVDSVTTEKEAKKMIKIAKKASKESDDDIEDEDDL